MTYCSRLIRAIHLAAERRAGDQLVHRRRRAHRSKRPRRSRRRMRSFPTCRRDAEDIGQVAVDLEDQAVVVPRLPGQNHIQPGPRINVPITIMMTHRTMNPKMNVQIANLRCLYV